MKSYFLIAAIGLSVGFHSALAQQGHEAHHPPADSPKVESSASEDGALMMETMMQRMEQMQSDMDQLAQSEDPAERQTLIESHRQQLQEFGDMIRRMHDAHHGEMKHSQGMKMGPGKGMKHHGGQMMMMGMMEAYRQMDKRLDLMQAVIENLLLQE